MLVVSSSGAAAQNSSAASDGISAVAAAGVVTMEDLLEEILQQEILDEDDLLPEIDKNAAGLSPANRSIIGQGGGAGGGEGAPVGCKQALKTAKSWRQPRPSAENMRASTHAPPDATALLSSLAALPSSPVSSNGGGSPSKTPPWFRVPQLSQRASQTPPSPSKRSPKGENPPSGAAEMV